MRPQVILRQKPIVQYKHMGTIADSANQAGEAIGCVGMTYLYGLIYSDRELTLTINEAINAQVSSLTYRGVFTDTILAGVPYYVDWDVYAPVMQTILANSSGDTANVEALLFLRAIK